MDDQGREVVEVDDDTADEAAFEERAPKRARAAARGDLPTRPGGIGVNQAERPAVEVPDKRGRDDTSAGSARALKLGVRREPAPWSTGDRGLEPSGVGTRRTSIKGHQKVAERRGTIEGVRTKGPTE